jgi:hypothetical protein
MVLSVFEIPFEFVTELIKKKKLSMTIQRNPIFICLFAHKEVFIFQRRELGKYDRGEI